MRIKSYLLVFILSLVLFFIIGFRLGEKVEKQNQINSLILTPTITPFPKKEIEYQDYKSKKYNLKIIYPKGFQIIESTKEALIEVKKK